MTKTDFTNNILAALNGDSFFSMEVSELEAPDGVNGLFVQTQDGDTFILAVQKLSDAVAASADTKAAPAPTKAPTAQHTPFRAGQHVSIKDASGIFYQATVDSYFPQTKHGASAFYRVLMTHGIKTGMPGILRSFPAERVFGSPSPLHCY